MSDQIVDATLFNAENIKYTSAKVNASGGKSVGILNKSINSSLRLQTPEMLTWGASDFDGNQKYEMSLQFPSEEYTNPDAEAFLQNMIEFETKIKNDALIYSKEWFGKKHNSPEVVEALWTPMLKYPKDKSTGEFDKTKMPVLKIKLPMYDGVWKVEVYDVNDEKLFPASNVVSPLEFLQKGSKLYSAIQCGGLWFANGKFGLTWRLMQVVVQQQKQSLTGRCLINIKPSDKQKFKQQTLPEVIQENNQSIENYNDTQVEDSDDENEIPQTVDEDNQVNDDESQINEDHGESAPLDNSGKKKRVVKKK